MRSLTTVTSGPNYIADSSVSRLSAAPLEPHDYVAGVLAHGFERVRLEIGRRSRSDAATSKAAPVFQLTPVARVELQRFIASLEPFVALSIGWNGAGSQGPNRTSLVSAVVGCVKLVQSGLPAPRPKILKDGTLGGFWRGHGYYATMEFEEDGEHVWTVSDGRNYQSGTWKSGEAVPKAIDVGTVDSES